MNVSDKIRIGLIGCGVMGKQHSGYIINDENTEVAAVADPFPAAKEFAAKINAPYYEDYVHMLEDAKPDAVIISTPNKLHVPQATEVLKRRIPMLVEKPISDNMEEAWAFADAAEKAGVPVLVGHYRRHNPYVRKAKEIIASGRLGKIVAVVANWLLYKPDQYFKDAEWRTKKGGGPILINMVHDVDLLRYLFGEIASISAMTNNLGRGFEVEDTAVVNIRFQSGTLASVTTSDCAVCPWSWEATTRENPAYAPEAEDCYLITGTEGSITMPQLKLWKPDGTKSWFEPLICEKQPVKYQLPYALQLQHFCDVIKGKAQPVSTPADAIRSVEALMALSQSAEKGTAITVTKA